MKKYIYISHGSLDLGNKRTDLDAIASIGTFWRGAILNGWTRGEEFDVDMIDYYNEGLWQLKKWAGCKIYLADIPPEALARPERPETLPEFEKCLVELKNLDIELNYIDHHPMTDTIRAAFQEWQRKGLFNILNICPMDLEMDRTTPSTEKSCATEMVWKFMQERWGIKTDDVFEKIMYFTHDADFGIRKVDDATALSVVIGADYDPLRIAELLANGTFWSDELQTIHDERIERDVHLLNQVSLTQRIWTLPSGREIPVMYLLMPEEDGLKVTAAGYYCTSEKGATVAVILQRAAFISMRINPGEQELHAGRILTPLGGGGHVGAASAGSRGHNFPYERADESSFESIVDRLDTVLSENAGVETAA